MANILTKSINKIKSWTSTDQGTMDRNWSSLWWQEGKTPGTVGGNPDVAAAISLYKRALTAVPAKHIIRNKDGAGITANTNSRMWQVIRRPNKYMSFHELVGVMVDGLLRKGEFCLYVEDPESDFLDISVHPIHSFTMMTAEDGSVFYGIQLPQAARHLNGEEVIHIPQRHIIHGRYEVDPVNPLRAMNPLLAYANSVGLGSAIRAGQEAFNNNMSKPSGLLTTDQALTKDQAELLRSRWAEMSRKMKQGETPILSSGLKWQATSVNANESQAIQMLGLTTKDICKAYGIPPVMLGENSGVTYSNLEQLMYGWRTTGLLSLCRCIEDAFEYTFQIPENEEMIFDIADLARAESMHQAETLKGLVQNGIMKPNEARAKLDLPPEEGVANTLVSQSQIQPMEQSAQIARDTHKTDQESKQSEIKLRDAQAAAKPAEVRAQQEAAKNPPQPPAASTPSDKPEEKPVKKSAPEIDMESLDLMLKGVFNSK